MLRNHQSIKSEFKVYSPIQKKYYRNSMYIVQKLKQKKIFTDYIEKTNQYLLVQKPKSFSEIRCYNIILKKNQNVIDLLIGMVLGLISSCL